nr:OmpA family protein [Gemmobacter serpentinus]
MRFLLSLSTLAALAACGDMNREVGAEVDSGYFGNSTMNNTMVQMGAIDAQALLAQRFNREVPPTITFPFNSASLTPEARSVLDLQASWMRQFPELRFSVYGHTDLVGGDSYNKALGKRRAQAVVAYLGSRGISSSRLDALVSFGKTQPVVHTLGPEERNRRTVTEVSGWANRKSGPLSGKYAEVIHREYVESARRAIDPPTQVTQLNISN